MESRYVPRIDNIIDQIKKCTLQYNKFPKVSIFATAVPDRNWGNDRFAVESYIEKQREDGSAKRVFCSHDILMTRQDIEDYVSVHGRSENDIPASALVDPIAKLHVKLCEELDYDAEYNGEVYVTPKNQHNRIYNFTGEMIIEKQQNN